MKSPYRTGQRSLAEIVNRIMRELYEVENDRGMIHLDPNKEVSGADFVMNVANILDEAGFTPECEDEDDWTDDEHSALVRLAQRVVDGEGHIEVDTDAVVSELLGEHAYVTAYVMICPECSECGATLGTFHGRDCSHGNRNPVSLEDIN